MTTNLYSTLTLKPITFQTDILDRDGKVVQTQAGQADEFDEILGNDLILPLITLPGGTFQMGSPHGHGYEDETPRHLVLLAPFLIGKTLITQAQWQAVMSKLPPCRFHGADLPIERVTWKEAQAFCQALAHKTGHAYRLPSEAQWEYACRGGTATAFSTGETITTDYANYCGEHQYLHEPKGLYRHMTTTGNAFPPNPFGINEMHGNLWELCADTWHADYSGAPFDGTAWERGGERGYRSARGGSWHEPPINCRSAARLRVAENEADDLIGLRVVLVP